MTLIIIPIYLQPIIKGWTEELFIEDFTSAKKVKEKAKKRQYFCSLDQVYFSFLNFVSISHFLHLEREKLIKDSS